MHVSTDTAFLLGSILGPGGAALAVASRYLPRPRPTTPEAQTATPAPDGWLPCHAPCCGHMSTPSTRTPTGLACRNCGAPRMDRP